MPVTAARLKIRLNKIAPLFAAATEGNHHLQRMLNEPEVSAECLAECLADADLMDLKFEPKRYDVMLSCLELEAEIVKGSTSVWDFSVCDPAFTNQLEEECDALDGKLKCKRLSYGLPSELRC